MFNKMSSGTNYYQLLNLPSKSALSQENLKQAYRKALLAHHPDKRSPNPASKVITIDDVALAYKTLSDLQLRAEYDAWLESVGDKNIDQGPASNKPRHTGLETVDLDDLAFDDVNETWSRSCRCGEAMGFVVTSAELEKQVGDGEIIVGCRGCSLWLRILFGIEEG